ncbi:D-alanine transaminase [Alkalibacillus filiformis]|uniref:D-alanine aminotransferase n=1 Tax=Alkalibacillus filiformis TaxID=200990 RepID=A0ABU0DTH0_9BACI|nr:D-amino-acid transaminase [Alkalibacillus filiformis]MDQ0351753.1 D-alanine transaminase [Alkalibacillus filiformis]
MIVLKNNDFIERNEATIDMEDRGHQFGDGVYEVVRVYDGEAFLLQDHLDRLQYSLNEVEINYDVNQQGLSQLLQQLIEKNKINDGGIYLQITRGVAPRNHPYPEDTQPVLFAYPLQLSRPLKAQAQGITTILQKDFRWLRCDIKSLNLLGNVMTKQKASNANAGEAIFYRDENHVTEGSSTNVFIVKDDKLYTHPADNLILNGITRRYIFHLANQLNIPYEEKVFSLTDLKEADEVFITSTSAEVTPVVEIEGQKIANGQPGPISKKLLDAFFEYKNVGQLTNV